MSRKSRRATVNSVSSGLSEAAEVLQSAGETVSDTVTATGRKARKQARRLASRAADSLPVSMKPAAKPKHRKRKVAIVLVVLAGAGVAAKKFLGGKSAT